MEMVKIFVNYFLLDFETLVGKKPVLRQQREAT